jgi:hypothetical protein
MIDATDSTHITELMLPRGTIRQFGCCDFCNRGRLNTAGDNLLFPYKEVTKLNGRGTASVACDACLNAIAEKSPLHKELRSSVSPKAEKAHKSYTKPESETIIRLDDKIRVHEIDTKVAAGRGDYIEAARLDALNAGLRQAKAILKQVLA